MLGHAIYIKSQEFHLPILVVDLCAADHKDGIQKAQGRLKEGAMNREEAFDYINTPLRKDWGNYRALFCTH